MEPHGKMTCEWHGNVLHVYLKEATNFEGATLMYKELQNIVRSRTRSIWKRLVILRSDAIGTHDVLNLIKEVDLFCRFNGCRAVAYVIGSPIQMIHYKQISQLDKEVFTDIEPALEWLKNF